MESFQRRDQLISSFQNVQIRLFRCFAYLLGSFTQTFISKGYKSSMKDQPAPIEPTLEIITKCSGPEMGYVTTPASVLTCALILLDPATKTKVPHGVLTPASAFSNVVDEVISGLSKRGGVEFTLVSRRELS